MTIYTHPTFDKHFQKRIVSDCRLVKKFRERMELLTGTKKNLRSFSVTGNIRVIYERFSTDEVTLIDIGTHNQVY